MSSHGTIMLVIKKRMLPIFLNDSSVNVSKSAVRPAALDSDMSKDVVNHRCVQEKREGQPQCTDITAIFTDSPSRGFLFSSREVTVAISRPLALPTVCSLQMLSSGVVHSDVSSLKFVTHP